MDARGDAARSRTPLIIIVIVALIAGGVAWGYLAAPGTVAPAAQSTETPVPPVPTEFPTPQPGTTEDVPAVVPAVVTADQTGSPQPGVEARVVDMERFEASDGLPGDAMGPAVRVSVEVANTGDTPIDTSGSALSVDFGDELVPGSEIGVGGEGALPATIPPGQHATVVGAFAIPVGENGGMRISLDLLAGKPVVIFQADLPDA